MKTKAIIQARFRSTRLPGKVLFKVLNKTILEYVIERVKKAKHIEGAIVATSIKEEDLKIVNLADSIKITVHRGSEKDVLDRFYQAAKLFNLKHIVRITADCPLVDPRIIDDVICHYFKSGADYCSNTLDETFPDGEDIEVFSFGALTHAWGKASLLSDREHVTSYIRKHPAKFKLASFKNREDLTDKRWTLDVEEDFKFIKAILEALYPANPDFHMEDILEFLQRNPHLENLNKNITRNEGYLKSLKEDRIFNREA